MRRLSLLALAVAGCALIINPGPPCETDADCSADRRCDEGACVPASGSGGGTAGGVSATGGGATGGGATGGGATGGGAGTGGGRACEDDMQFCMRIGVACGTGTGVDNCDAGRTVTCGQCPQSGFCDAGRCDCTPQTDPEECMRLGRQCGPFSGLDNCGRPRNLDCGVCPFGTCTNGVCPSCMPETNARFCERQMKNCGTLSGTDNCMQPRTVNCGPCTDGGACGDGGIPNVCGCTAETNPQFCQRQLKNCGTVSGVDNCGQPRTAGCGACTDGGTCSGGGIANVCGCTPTTCAAQGRNCGTISNGCGGSLSCGTCVAPETCGGGGTANVCGCTGESEATLCNNRGYECGTHNVLDSCNVTRTISCGGCNSGKTCSGGTCVCPGGTFECGGSCASGSPGSVGLLGACSCNEQCASQDCCGGQCKRASGESCGGAGNNQNCCSGVCTGGGNGVCQ